MLARKPAEARSDLMIFELGPETGVPDGAARQKTRSTGCNYAGWEILALDYLLAGIFFQRLAC